MRKLLLNSNIKLKPNRRRKKYEQLIFTQKYKKLQEEMIFYIVQTTSS